MIESGIASDGALLIHELMDEDKPPNRQVIGRSVTIDIMSFSDQTAHWLVCASGFSRLRASAREKTYERWNES
jgi:hypothetical protein